MSFDLKSWRLRLGLTQESAADLLGVHRVTVARWESGACAMPKLIGMACLNYESMLKQKQGLGVDLNSTG
jgi:transcriptional regulator with XRE-family HTH domain